MKWKLLDLLRLQHSRTHASYGGCPEQDQPSQNPTINKEGVSQDPPLTEALPAVDGWLVKENHYVLKVGPPADFSSGRFHSH